MPHIALALEGFFPENIGGTEHYVLNLAKELRELNYRVSIIKPSKQPQIHQYQYDGFEVYCFPIAEKPTVKELNGLEMPGGIEFFLEIIKNLNPDIFHLHSLGRALNTQHIKAVFEMSIKTVFTAHIGSNFCVRGNFMLFGKAQCNGLVDKHRCLACFINQQKKMHSVVAKPISFVIRQLLLSISFVIKYPAFRIIDYKLEQISLIKKYSHVNIAIGDWLREIYELNGLKNTVTIKQGIDKSFGQFESKKSKSSNKINLIFVGRMHPLKNLDLLIMVLKDFAGQINLIVVTIPFDEEMLYYQKVKKNYDDLGYTDWFENLTSPQVAEKMGEADMLVLPSQYEVAPLVILEAFAKKIPVIGSDYIAIKEMIKHNVNGLLFKNGDSKSLKEQLLRLINEPELLHSLRQNIESVRTFKEVAAEHDVVYKKLVG